MSKLTIAWTGIVISPNAMPSKHRKIDVLIDRTARFTVLVKCSMVTGCVSLDEYRVGKQTDSAHRLNNIASNAINMNKMMTTPLNTPSMPKAKKPPVCVDSTKCESPFATSGL